MVHEPGRLQARSDRPTQLLFLLHQGCERLAGRCVGIANACNATLAAMATKLLPPASATPCAARRQPAPQMQPSPPPPGRDAPPACSNSTLRSISTLAKSRWAPLELHAGQHWFESLASDSLAPPPAPWASPPPLQLSSYCKAQWNTYGYAADASCQKC